MLSGRDWRRSACDQCFLRYCHPNVFNDHAPPHFHAIYGDREAVIGIESLEVLEGDLQRRALALVREWANLHRQELLADWDLCRAKQQPAKIAPLE